MCDGSAAEVQRTRDGRTAEVHPSHIRARASSVRRVPAVQPSYRPNKAYFRLMTDGRRPRGGQTKDTRRKCGGRAADGRPTHIRRPSAAQPPSIRHIDGWTVRRTDDGCATDVRRQRGGGATAVRRTRDGRTAEVHPSHIRARASSVRRVPAVLIGRNKAYFRLMTDGLGWTAAARRTDDGHATEVRRTRGGRATDAHPSSVRRTAAVHPS